MGIEGHADCLAELLAQVLEVVAADGHGVQVAGHGTDGVDQDGRAVVVGLEVVVAGDEEALVEERVHGVHPGKVELEEVVEDGLVGGDGGPSHGCRADASHLLIRGVVIYRMLRLEGREGLQVGDGRAPQPVHYALVCFAGPEALEDVGHLLAGGERLEDLLREMVLCPELLDLLDQLLLCMLDMDLVDALRALGARLAPPARLLAITLPSTLAQGTLGLAREGGDGAVR